MKAADAAYVREVLKSPLLVVWALFIFATPFYILPSGLPQPGDALVFLLVPTALLGWNGRLPRAMTRVLYPLLAFAVWVFFVNYGWAIMLDKLSFSEEYTLFPFFYFFNAVVFLSALIAYQRHGDTFLRVTIHVVLVSVLFQVVASFFYRTDFYRGQVFFNNPNQLGYYSLLAACLIALCQHRINMGLLMATIGLTGCAYLALLSGSRAALIGIAILTFLQLFSNLKLAILASLVAIALFALGGPISNALDRTVTRALENRNPNLTFAEERGYDRLWDYKEYMLIGAGEGDLSRFTDDPRREHEIHSSAATVLFSYGILGASLILVFIFRVIRGAPLRSALTLLPVLTYTIAHQGLRFTMLWILMVVFVTLKVPPKQRVPAARPPLPHRPLAPSSSV